jgi:hypothetical protein
MTMETVLTVVAVLSGFVLGYLLLTWGSRTDTLLTEIRDVLIEIRDQP